MFALGQATGEGAGQRATGTVIAAGQALAGKGFAATVAAVQAIVYFVFVAMTAGDQQVFDERQEFFSAHSSAVPSGSSARMRASGRLGGGNDRKRQQAFAHGVADFVLAQSSAATGAQHRVADHRQMRVR